MKSSVKLKKSLKYNYHKAWKKADDLPFEFDCDRSAPQNELIDSQINSGNCQLNIK